MARTTIDAARLHEGADPAAGTVNTPAGRPADGFTLRWSAASKLAAEVAGRGLQFALAYLAQRTLGQALYGEFTFSVATGFVCSAFTDLGLPLIVTRGLARDRASAAGIAGAGLALKMLFSLAAGLVVTLVGLSRPPEVRAASVAVGLSMLLASFVDFFGYVFRGLQRVEIDAALGLLVRALSAVLGALALVGGLGLAGLAGAYLAASALAALGAYVWLRARFLAPRLSFDRAAWTGVLREALPLGGAVVLSILYTRTAIFALDRLGGVESVGLYGVAQKLTEPLAIIPAALLAAVFPALSQALARPGGAAMRLRRRTLALLGLAGSGIALAGLLGGPWLVARLYAGQYAGAEIVLQILALAALPAFVNYALTHFLVAQGRQHLNLAFNAVILVVNAILCLMLIPRLGPAGAAIAVAVSETALFAMCWRVGNRGVREAGSPESGVRSPKSGDRRIAVQSPESAVGGTDAGGRAIGAGQ